MGAIFFLLRLDVFSEGRQSNIEKKNSFIDSRHIPLKQGENIRDTHLLIFHEVNRLYRVYLFVLIDYGEIIH